MVDTLQLLAPQQLAVNHETKARQLCLYYWGSASCRQRCEANVLNILGNKYRLTVNYCPTSTCRCQYRSKRCVQRAPSTSCCQRIPGVGNSGSVRVSWGQSPASSYRWKRLFSKLQSQQTQLGNHGGLIITCPMPKLNDSSRLRSLYKKPISKWFLFSPSPSIECTANHSWQHNAEQPKPAGHWYTHLLYLLPSHAFYATRLRVKERDLCSTCLLQHCCGQLYMLHYEPPAQDAQPKI